MQENDKKNKVAIVTGGSRGIGRAICVMLAKQGFDICVNYAGNAQAAEETKILCEAYHVQAMAYQADVSQASQCDAMVAAVLAMFGRVDVLVNNAGITKDGLLMRMSEADFDAVLQINLKGAFLCTKCVARAMMKQRYGRIINLSSVVGVHGNAGQANYAASKAGLIGFTKSVAKELARRGITANIVAPGFITTDMTQNMPEAAKIGAVSQIPMQREGNAVEVAAAVAFLAAEGSGYITGQVLCVDGGMGM